MFLMFWFSAPTCKIIMIYDIRAAESYGGGTVVELKVTVVAWWGSWFSDFHGGGTLFG